MARYNLGLSTSLSSRRWTYATLFLTSIVLHTKVDVLCDKLAMVVGEYVDNACDGRRAMIKNQNTWHHRHIQIVQLQAPGDANVDLW